MATNFQKPAAATRIPRAPLISFGSAVCASLALAGWWFSSGYNQPPATAASASGMTCDMGISPAKAARGSAPITVQPVSANTQTAAQSLTDSPRTRLPPPPGPAPEGMVWIPGGEFWMGADEFPDAQPWHRASVDGFWMDKTEVTNDQFAKFVKATNYVTMAERPPRAEDFPGAPPENLVAGS